MVILIAEIHFIKHFSNFMLAKSHVIVWNFNEITMKNDNFCIIIWFRFLIEFALYTASFNTMNGWSLTGRG